MTIDYPLARYISENALKLRHCILNYRLATDHEDAVIGYIGNNRYGRLLNSYLIRWVVDEGVIIEHQLYISQK